VTFDLTRDTLLTAIGRMAERTDSADDLLTLVQAWAGCFIEEADDSLSDGGEYVQTMSATMLGQDPAAYWAEGRTRKVGF